MTDLRTLTPLRLPVRPATIVSVDLGQRFDFTALSILRKATEARPLPDAPAVVRPVSVYEVPYLDRTRGTSYEAIVAEIAKLMREPDMAGATLVIDETGVGVAIGDLLEARGLRPERITIHGGDAVTQTGRRHGVPKRDLVTITAVLLESGRLKVAEELALAQTFAEEMQTFKVTISASGHDSYGVANDWRQNAHDDLLLSVAMGIWWGEQPSRAVWKA